MICPLIVKEAISDKAKRNWRIAGGVAFGIGAIGGGIYGKSLRNLKNIKQQASLMKGHVNVAKSINKTTSMVPEFAKSMTKHRHTAKKLNRITRKSDKKLTDLINKI